MQPHIVEPNKGQIWKRRVWRTLEQFLQLILLCEDKISTISAGGLFTPLLLRRQPNNLPKYPCCNFRLLFILRAITNREDWLSLFQLSQLFYSFKGLWCRSSLLQLFQLDNPSSSNPLSQFRVSKSKESIQQSKSSSKHSIYHALWGPLKLASYIAVFCTVNMALQFMFTLQPYRSESFFWQFCHFMKIISNSSKSSGDY